MILLCLVPWLGSAPLVADPHDTERVEEGRPRRADRAPLRATREGRGDVERRRGEDALVVSLAEHLYLAEDPVLRGAEATLGLSVTRPATWELSGDPVLALRFSHAPDLAENSRLTVLLDGREVGEVPLDADNAEDGVLAVPLPAHALGEHARVTLVARQRRDARCDGPFDAGLWTRVGADSTITFPGAPKPFEASLAALRAPLFDPLGYGPLTLTPVLDGPLAPTSLDAVAELGLAFGRLAEWRGVTVAPPVARVEDAEGPALLVGTVAELPPLDGLVDASALQGAQGLIALVPNPADPALPVLVVTARSAEGLANAARAVARADRAAWLTGPVTIVENVPDAPPPAPSRRPLPLGDRERVTLADLGLADHTVSGLYAGPLRAPVELEADVLARPDGAEVLVRYAYGAGLDPALSTLEVRFGGVGLASVRLDRPEGEDDARVTVKIPARLVGPTNALEVAFHLLPDTWDTCAAAPADHLWGTVFADTEVRIARDHAVDLPDLALLRHRWAPFGGEDGAPLTVELGDRAEPSDVAAALQVLANVGARSVAEDPRVRLVAGRPETGGNRVLLAREDLPHPGRAGLGRHGGPRTAGIASVSALHRDDGDVLVLEAPDGPGLLRLAGHLGSDRVLERLAGSRAVIGDGGEVAVVEHAAKRRVWRATGVDLWRVRAQEEAPALVLGLVPSALAMAAALRAWARRRGGVSG